MAPRLLLAAPSYLIWDLKGLSAAVSGPSTVMKTFCLYTKTGVHPLYMPSVHNDGSLEANALKKNWIN